MAAHVPPAARRDALTVSSVLFVLVVFTALAWHRRWMSDDAFIDLRVVQQLLAGHGPVFNQGERVEAYTNPLWIAVLTLVGGPVRWILGDAAGLPWTAVIVGLACTVAALAIPSWSAARLPVRDQGPPAPRLSLPLGLSVVAALPPFWDFATSGLETGLTFLWLAASYTAFDRAAHARTSVPPWLALLLGAGPLVRPDLAVFAFSMALGLLVLARGQPRFELVRFVLVALAPLVAYQVFRMGYFAALTPATALAKEASTARWDQGLAYLLDVARPYHLAVPALSLGGWWLWTLRGKVRSGDVPGVVVVVAPVLGAIVHGLYIVRVGGDFMHARLLLPTCFAMLLPVLLVSGRPRAVASLAVVVGLWAVACAIAFRVPYAQIGPAGIADERTFYARASHEANPIRADQDRYSYPVTLGRFYRSHLHRPRALLYAVEIAPGQLQYFSLPLAPWVQSHVAGTSRQIGRSGFLAGLDVHIVDYLGLSDAYAARLQLGARGRPGHEKNLPDPWILARFTSARVPLPPGGEVAREALHCGDLAVLHQAITGPLTLRRFVQNMALAPRLTALRIPPDPVLARRQFCGG